MASKIELLVAQNLFNIIQLVTNTTNIKQTTRIADDQVERAVAAIT
jgi:hypothetical protein